MAHRRLRAGLCALAGAVALALAATAPVGAAGAVVRPSSGRGPVTEYGTVAFVADGDTIDVKIDDVPADPGRQGTRIRFLGIQAMELYEYHHDVSLDTGECHAIEATARLKTLLTTSDGQGRRVRLTARDASSRNLGRVARFVAVLGTGGKWHDVGLTMLTEGQVIAASPQTEYTNNRAYRLAAQTAAAKGLGIWDTDFCGRGPSGDLTIRVRWDADGNDATNVNGEYMKITNHGRRTVDLSEWWVRDSAIRANASKTAARRGYVLPAGAKVAAGQSVYVHVGRKPRSAKPGHYYYGLTAPIFDNVTSAPSHLGDGAYLFDPRGNLREWHQYPCLVNEANACGS